MEKPRLPSPSGLPGPLPSFWGGAQCVRGPKSCPLTPGEVRRTSTLERGSQWARNQVPTPAWGQARHQLRCGPSRTAQRPAAVRTTAWQRRRSVHGSAARPPRGVEPTSAWGHGSQPLPPTPPKGGPGARSRALLQSSIPRADSLSEAGTPLHPKGPHASPHAACVQPRRGQARGREDGAAAEGMVGGATPQPGSPSPPSSELLLARRGPPTGAEK